MNDVIWLQDKEKDGEIYSNSYCLKYVLKFFTKENMIQLWGNGWGYKKVFETNEDALNEYVKIKTKNDKEIQKYLKKNYEKCQY